MNQKQVVASLLEKANKYREFARWIGDRETVHHILGIAAVRRTQRAAVLRAFLTRCWNDGSQGFCSSGLPFLKLNLMVPAGGKQSMRKGDA